MYVNIHKYIHIRIQYICMHICIYIYIYIYICVYMHTHLHTSKSSRKHVACCLSYCNSALFAGLSLHVYIHICIYIYRERDSHRHIVDVRSAARRTHARQNDLRYDIFMCIRAPNPPATSQ